MSDKLPAWKPASYRHGDLVAHDGKVWQYVSDYEQLSIDDAEPGKSSHWRTAVKESEVQR